MPPKTLSTVPLSLLEWAPFWLRLRRSDEKYRYAALTEDRRWDMPVNVDGSTMADLKALQAKLPLISYLGPGVLRATGFGLAAYASISYLQATYFSPQTQYDGLWRFLVCVAAGINYFALDVFHSLLRQFHVLFKTVDQRREALENAASSKRLSYSAVCLLVTLLGIAGAVTGVRTYRESQNFFVVSDAVSLKQLQSVKILAASIEDVPVPKATIEFLGLFPVAPSGLDCVDFALSPAPVVDWFVIFTSARGLKVARAHTNWQSVPEFEYQHSATFQGNPYTTTYGRVFTASSPLNQRPESLVLEVTPAAGAEIAALLEDGVVLAAEVSTRCQHVPPRATFWQLKDSKIYFHREPEGRASWIAKRVGNI